MKRWMRWTWFGSIAACRNEKFVPRNVWIIPFLYECTNEILQRQSVRNRDLTACPGDARVTWSEAAEAAYAGLR